MKNILLMADAADGEKSTGELIAGAAGGVIAGAASVLLGPGAVADIISLAAKFGIPAAMSLIDLYKKAHDGGVTVEEVKSAFAALKTYEEYGIPDKVPTVDNTGGA